MAMLAGCRPQASEPAAPPETLIEREELQSGDLLLFALPLDYRLKGSTQSKDTTVTPIHKGDEVNYFHIAIVERRGESLYTIDASIKYDVDCHPMDTTLAAFTIKNGRVPRVEVFRLKDPSDAELFVEQAKRFMGRRYDTHLESCPDEIYCSELISYSFVTREGDTLFPLRPMDWTSSDGTMTPYWTEIFRRIGMVPPNGLPGITPRDVAQSGKVEQVGVLVDCDL